MFTITLTVVLLVTIIWYLILKKRNKRSNTYFDQIKGPKGLPIVGNSLDFLFNDILKVIFGYDKKYGPITKINLGFKGDLLLISNPELVAFLLKHPSVLEKPLLYESTKKWLGSGLVSCSLEEWKETRPLATTAFRKDVLEAFLHIFNSCGDVLTRQLSSNTTSKSFDIYPYLALTTLDIIFEAAMGYSLNSQEEKSSAYAKAIEDLTTVVMNKNFSILKQIPIFYRFTDDYHLENKALETINNCTAKQLSEIKKRIKIGQQIESNIETHNTIGDRFTFLNYLVECKTSDGKSLSDFKIFSEINTYIFGGQHTTAGTIGFVLYSLSKSPEIQDSVLKEQKEIFQDDFNRSVTSSDLNRMTYLHKVVKETLRLYAVLPLVGRRVTEDVTFENEVISKGQNVLLFIYAIHKNPEYYPNPDSFDPDRFAEAPIPNTFLPFSLGKRNCIGQKFAMLAIKTVISKLIRKYEIISSIPEHKLDLTFSVTLKSTNGIKVGLKIR